MPLARLGRLGYCSVVARLRNDDSVVLNMVRISTDVFRVTEPALHPGSVLLFSAEDAFDIYTSLLLDHERLSIQVV